MASSITDTDPREAADGARGPRFSIVIPTYNEEQDIRQTLDSLVGLTCRDREIIVVDDSTDRTPDIVREFAKDGVRLIHPGGGGRCEARNIGIENACGEIVCILNADVRLPKDFFERIEPHYDAGYDYVLVDARVSNMDDLFARYVACATASQYNASTAPDRIDWTEGFTCRREKALEAGLFPTGLIVKICAGEDGFFGQGLRRAGARKKIDWSIAIDHICPSTWQDYWNTRKGRGEGGVQVHRLLNGWSYRRIALRTAVKTARSTLAAVLLVPGLAYCGWIARKSPRGIADTFPFFWAWAVEAAAMRYGEWRMIATMMRKEAEAGGPPTTTPQTGRPSP